MRCLVIYNVATFDSKSQVTFGLDCARLLKSNPNPGFADLGNADFLKQTGIKSQVNRTEATALDVNARGQFAPVAWKDIKVGM